MGLPVPCIIILAIMGGGALLLFCYCSYYHATKRHREARRPCRACRADQQLSEVRAHGPAAGRAGGQETPQSARTTRQGPPAIHYTASTMALSSYQQQSAAEKPGQGGLEDPPPTYEQALRQAGQRSVTSGHR